MIPKIQSVIRRLIGSAVQGDHKAAVALLNVAERVASPSSPPAGVSSPPETLEPADEAIVAAHEARAREGRGGGDDGPA